jgi:hypothetical protein
VAEGDRRYCVFSWGAGSSQLVAEGHRICALENNHPPSNYEIVRNYVASEHPNYSQVQINTQLIAAEKLLC